MSYSAVAKALGVGVGTLHAALRALREPPPEEPSGGGLFSGGWGEGVGVREGLGSRRGSPDAEFNPERGLGTNLDFGDDFSTPMPC